MVTFSGSGKGRTKAVPFPVRKGNRKRLPFRWPAFTFFVLSISRKGSTVSEEKVTGNGYLSVVRTLPFCLSFAPESIAQKVKAGQRKGTQFQLPFF